MNGDRLCMEVSRLRWGRPTWAIPVLLLLAVLLVAGVAFNLANPVGVFLAITMLAAIVLLVALLRRGMGPPELEEESVDKPAARHAAADAVQDAIQELELGGDVRSAILACFRRFCLLLGARGITAQGALTPRELDSLAVERLRVSRDASGTLTSLFEEARYSVHPLGEADRRRAIESLAGIRAALEA